MKSRLWMKGGLLNMGICRAMEEMLEQERKEAAVKIASKLLADGKLTCEEIAYCVNLPLDEVKKLVL